MAATASKARRGSEPRRAAPPTVPPARTVSPWLKAFVAFHVVAITVWSLPRPKADLMLGKVAPYGSDHLLLFNAKTMTSFAPISAYLQTTGTWQYWDMFAPDPSRADVYGDAEIEMLDGTKRAVGYPRMYRLSLFDRYLKERYRKFYERAGDGQNAYLWPMFAATLARGDGDRPEEPARRGCAPPTHPAHRPAGRASAEDLFGRGVLPVHRASGRSEMSEPE